MVHPPQTGTLIWPSWHPSPPTATQYQLWMSIVDNNKPKPVCTPGSTNQHIYSAVLVLGCVRLRPFQILGGVHNRPLKRTPASGMPICWALPLPPPPKGASSQQ